MYKITMDHSRIDVHHHLFPPPFVAQLIEHEHYLARGVARHWTPQVSIEDMDAAGIATAFTSITAPGLAFLPHERLFTINRECNDFGARSARRAARAGLARRRRAQDRIRERAAIARPLSLGLAHSVILMLRFFAMSTHLSISPRTCLARTSGFQPPASSES